jgi:hypothetical protein
MGGYGTAADQSACGHPLAKLPVTVLNPADFSQDMLFF